MTDIFKIFQKAKDTTQLSTRNSKSMIIIHNLGKKCHTDLGGSYHKFEVIYEEWGE